MYICTSDLRDKKQCCQLIDRNVRLLFRHWTSSVSVSVLCFQLAAGQGPLTIALQQLQNTITSGTTNLQTRATVATQQVQDAGYTALLSITLQTLAALKNNQEYASSTNDISQQAQACLTQETQNLTAVGNASRK